MNFTLDADHFRAALEKVMPAIPTRTPMPVLENILLVIEDELLTLTGTDLTSCLITKIKGIKATGNIQCLLPAKLLFDLIKNLSGKLFIDFKDKGKVTISTDSGKYKLSYATADDYPILPTLEEGIVLSIDGQKLLPALDFVKDSVSTEDIRPAMCGILLQFKNEKLNLVSTDGHILSLYNLDLQGEGDFIIPSEATKILVKIAAGGGILNIKLNKSYLFLEVNDDVFISRLIGDKFPNYESIIPTDNEIIAVVNKNELLASIKRVMLINDRVNHDVRFTFTKNKIELSTTNFDSGNSAREEYACEYQGKDLKINFNGNILYPMLSKYPSEKLILKMKSADRAIIVTEKENDNITLIMPLRPTDE